MSEKTLISIENVNKSWGKNTVLNDISCSIDQGQVCCVIGENGAGKTTLMKLLYGVYNKTSGNIYFEGNEVNFSSPYDAQKLGIRMIFQDFQLIPDLTVYENIFLKHELYYKGTPFLNKSLMQSRAKEVLDRLQSKIDIHSKPKNLSYAEKQIIEIAKALAFETKLIIMDEPTSALIESEVDNLFKIIQRLKSLNVSFIYTSHRINEVKKIADKIVILRNGNIVAELDLKKDFPSSYFIKMMAGKDYTNKYPHIKSRRNEILLETENLANKFGSVKDLSISINKGEIVGLAGLQGAGKTSVANLLCGLEKKTNGKVFFDGQERNIKNTHAAKEMGIAFLSEYVEHNLSVQQNTCFNFSLYSLKHLSRLGFLNNRNLNLISKNYIKNLYLNIPYTKRSIRYYSQGILKKLALARLMYKNVKLFIMDEPSKDLDIASKVELYNIMNQLTNKGTSILLLSSDLEELVGMCDRIYIMYNGKIIKEIHSSEATSEKILFYASGAGYIDES